jgi:serpin B
MNHHFPRFALILLLLTSSNMVAAQEPETRTPAERPIPPPSITDGMNQFAFDLHRHLGSETTDNLFVSPASISTALTMTSAGARGETLAQMTRVLHLPEQQVHEGFAAMIQHLNQLGQQDDLELVITNTLWGQHDYEFLPEFTNLLATQYGADLRPVDFRRNTEGARVAINSWVEQQTREKIQDLIPEGVLTDLTTLVLTNAVYFLGQWQSPFSEEATRDLPFTTQAGEVRDVPMMFQESTLRYTEDDDAQVLELLYAGNVSMLLVLPREKRGLPALEAQLDPEKLQHWTARLRSRPVRVFLPKFTLTAEFQLKDQLTSLGMPDAFSSRADFSGMDGTRDLYLQEVVHKAFVDVNEKGTEAAAATGVVVGVRSARPTPTPEFRADHPFFFLIRDTQSGTILFTGRLNNPST